MRPAPASCPICQSELTVARLHCSSCDTTIEEIDIKIVYNYSIDISKLLI